jgi:hypothetical protein
MLLRAPLIGIALLLAGGAARGATAEAASGIRFREVSSAWGLEFRHHHGGSGERYMVETVCGGVVLFDPDGDGDPDVFFVDGGALPGYRGEAPRSRLFRNDGPGGGGAPRFVDASDRAGIEVAHYGCGAVSGDVDGDGDADLYVTELGANQLFRNEGDGTFTDVTAAAGVGETAWSTSATFFDADRDGDLDLYVANYVDFRVETHKFCGDRERGIQGYCHPDAYEPVPDRFYRNRGDGTFEDATRAAGLGGTAGPGLGVIAGDVDGDGWSDLYVANDAAPNFLFKNRGDGTFEDVSLLSGTAYGDRGRPEGGMGVDLGDVDGDGFQDLVVTNFELETNALYKNLGGGLFSDARYLAGLAEGSLRKLSFGVAFADFDQDGDLDLAIASGHILDNAELFNPYSRYAQEDQVYENLGKGRFREVAGAGLDDVRVSRGLAAGDLDGDGDPDLVVVCSNERAEVYEDLSGGAGHWLQVDAGGPGRSARGLGAMLELTAGDGPRQVREVRTASSYLSQNPLTVHFGLGDGGDAARLSVHWPSGRRQLVRGLPRDRRIVVFDGVETTR